VEIREPKLLIRAENAHINAETSTGQFGNTRFLFHDQGIRGTAETLFQNQDNTTTIENGTITQCTPDDETWLFEADNIHLNTETGLGTAKNAKLLVKGVPVVYLPYLTFPIDDRRTSGFLWPIFGSSGENGFNVTTPYYLNLAPNLDITLAPQYISNRGTMFEAEVRQLGDYGAWAFGAAQLSDNLYTDNPSSSLSEKELNNLPARENRWLGHIRQTGSFSGINTSIDYTKVSDNNYFRDLPNNSLDVKRTLHLKQLLALDYSSGPWRTDVIAEQRQTLDDDLNHQYKIMPRLSVTRNNSGSSFEAQWLAQAEITDFQHDEAVAKGGGFVTGQRAYAETGISYPMHWAAGFLIPTVKVRNLNYNLDSRLADGDDTLTATTPMATLDMGLIFERAFGMGDGEYTQTLEPRLYYFYSDYDDQEEHPEFDTKELTFSYNQLFRDTRFSGHDRLDDANQMSFGITSRFIENSSGREVITASIGQTFFFEDRRVTLEQDFTNTTQSKSFIATEIQYQPNNEMWFNNSLLWDSEQEKLQEAGFSFHYQRKGNSLYNLSYKFRRDGDSNLITGLQHLEQIDASLLLPINNHWSWYSRLQYDITENNSIDSLIGMQYEDCCWKVRLIYQEGFEDEFISEPEGSLLVETDHAFIIEFQLKGLGGLGSKSIEILKESILGYEDLE
ncbi:MAG: LPS-assembly protein, partial [Oceanicoccus sp.]